jgi:ESX secretion-associated protein EspG
VVLARPVRLSVAAVARMLRMLELGSPQVVIQPVVTWEEPDQGLAGDAVVWAEFAAAGLVQGPGRLTADVVDTLAVLGQASVEYFGWLSTEPGRADGVLAAALDQEAVYVVRRRDRVRLASIAATGLVETFVDSLSGPPPARIDAVNVRTGDLHRVDHPATSDGLLVPALPADGRDAAVVRGLLALPVTGLGELYVAARDDRGRYRVSEQPVWYRDTTAGRVMIIVSGEHVSIAPGTGAVLTERLRRVYREVTEQ